MITDVHTLTKEDRNDIAEFIYSYEADVLIKSDAERLLAVLIKHNLIVGKEGWVIDVNNNANNVSGRLYAILTQKLSSDVAGSIMEEYYTGATIK